MTHEPNPSAQLTDQDGNPIGDSGNPLMTAKFESVSLDGSIRTFCGGRMLKRDIAPDPTNPAHYQTDGGPQPIDLIEALGDGPAFCRANAIKYLARYDRKNGIEDLKKARWYTDRLIDLIAASKSDGPEG